MGLKFKPGDPVKQVIPPPITGVIEGAEIVEGDIHYKVGWIGDDGEHRAKFFTEEQLEASQ